MTRVKRSPPVQLVTLGHCTVNGRPTLHHRPAELVTLLAAHGGQLSRPALELALFGGESCPSALPTQVLRVRSLGIQIDFSAATKLYTLKTIVEIDALRFLQLIEQRCYVQAAQLYGGAFLHRSQGAYATELRTYLEDQLVQAAVASQDAPTLRHAAMQVWPDERLAEAMRRLPQQATLGVLLRAQLRGLNVA